MKKKSFIFKYLLLFVLIIVIYKFLIKLLEIFLDYNDKIIVLKNNFTSEEIKYLQECINDDNAILKKCYEDFQKKIITTIKDKMNLDYLHISFARFSNKTNYDGQTYHRDIKVKFSNYGPYPNVYTIVIYLDNAQIEIGNKIINAEPGDIVIFNAFCLHRTINFNKNKNRRVLQFFTVFFDKNEEFEFNKKHSYCQYIYIKFIEEYIYPFLDVRAFLEYFNLVSINGYNCSNNNYIYTTLINTSGFIATIDNIKYFRKV